METGTFITRDPLGFVDGPNMYAYVVQNPWTKFDPQGLEDEDANKPKPKAKTPEKSESVDSDVEGSDLQGDEKSTPSKQEKDPKPKEEKKPTLDDSAKNTEKNSRNVVEWNLDDWVDFKKGYKVYIGKLPDGSEVRLYVPVNPLTDTSGFNCHGFTFAEGKGHMNGQDVEKIISKEYIPTGSPAGGDVVLFKDDDPEKTGVKTTHSAVVSEVDQSGNVKVDSKPGTYPLQKNVSVEQANDPLGNGEPYGEPSFYKRK